MATAPSEYLANADVDALVRAKELGHFPERFQGAPHWSCSQCGYVAEQVRWWPRVCAPPEEGEG